MGIGAMHKHLGLRALSAPATHITDYPDELLSEVLTRRTGEGVGAAAVAAGAAEAAADARDGGAEQRSLLRVG